MKNEFPRLYELCRNMRSEIERLSEFKAAKLKDIANEFESHYEVWQSTYKGAALADPFCGFGQMLEDWKYPWEEVDGSDLSGLSPAQCYFGWAYAEIEAAIALLEGRMQINDANRSEHVEQIALSMAGAGKALEHAKHLLWVN